VTVVAAVLDPHATNPVAQGNVFMQLLALTFTGSYPTNGDSLDLESVFKQVGLGLVYVVSGFRGYSAEYVQTSKLLKLFSSANTELGAGAYNAALTATPVNVAVWGR
jgi:hypothetical protein